MDKKKSLWITLSLVNLSIAAFFGLSLRTKYLFPIPFINYRDFISAHSHFAFGGWVALAFLTLYTYYLLPEKFRQKNIYQVALWSIELTALGMAVTFPVQGYSLLAIILSTLFIFATYLYSYIFIRDIWRSGQRPVVIWLSVSAQICMVISSIGPYILAYILATKSNNSILYRDAVYIFLHFQYNGFFTLSVFALLFNKALPYADANTQKWIRWFALFLCASVIPALFLSLLWHPHNLAIISLSIIGCGLIILSIVTFFMFIKNVWQKTPFSYPLAKTFFLFSMIAFTIKMALQMGTVIPSLGNAVFGYRPIIIGFLHLVFLGFVSFYILSSYMESHMFTHKLSKPALILFAIAIILNETVLLVQGIGLLFSTTSHIYAWLLWAVAILLFTGAVLILAARLQSRRQIIANKKVMDGAMTVDKKSI